MIIPVGTHKIALWSDMKQMETLSLHARLISIFTIMFATKHVSNVSNKLAKNYILKSKKP